MVEKFEKTFVQLAQCELSPEERQAWWEENKVQLENNYPVAFFLNSKTIKHDFRWVPILASQKRAVEYLSARNIPFEFRSIPTTLWS
ncbi:heme/copper-type cytochrome/quinol oxidase subunit 2 [Paenibacillus jamilae]|uniref:hypothetical protein n=1 Tax=Paenibacillus polymyxa TaxID=1406 RepID=UPI0011B23A9E|nr:hypothetical protein [Paenibacillus polymyxa]MDP9676589.1 heme/copper-type cytochrome/quinol oxidase subunit 2 [Paenibacillus jamilae]